LPALCLAVIIKKAPQLQDDIDILCKCLWMFGEYHKATGFIFNLIFMKIENNPLDKIDIVNGVCESKCLFVNKRQLLKMWFNDLPDSYIKEMLDSPDKYSRIIDVVNTVMAIDLLFVRGKSNIKGAFVGPQAPIIVSFLYKDIMIKSDNHKEEANLYKNFMQQSQAKYNKGPAL
jgi:hypothetical protein